MERLGRHAHGPPVAVKEPAGRPAMRLEVPAGPVIDPSRGRRLLLAAFWLGLVFVILPWWVDTGSGSVAGTAQVLIAVGRITGLVGGYLLLVEILLMSRIRQLERWVGATRLMDYHRDVGTWLVVVVLAHVAFTVVGSAAEHDSRWPDEAALLYSTYPALVSAFVSAGILVVVGLFAVRAVRRVLPYEIWHRLHLFSYVALLAVYGHQFANGEQLARPGFARSLWSGLYLGVVACLFSGRVVYPLRLNVRHRLRVAEVVMESNDTFSMYVTGRRLEEMEGRAGQFYRWRFMATGCWYQAHPFSLSAAPNGMWLRLTIKVVGDHTARLSRLPRGVRVIVQGPHGDFTADRAVRRKVVLIAVGSGIAPIRALLEEAPPDTVVIYRANSRRDLVFRDELDLLAQTREADVWFVLGSRHDPESRHVFTASVLRRLVPDLARRDVYVCGPKGVITAVTAVLRRLHVPGRQIHHDPFEF
jgi:predicted ferric reductase